MAKLLPIVLVLFGLMGGGGAALFLRSGQTAAPDGQIPVSHESGHGDKDGHGKGDHGGPGPDEFGYFKFNRPFIVPVVADDEVVALAMLALSIEMGSSEARDALVKEPKVRDGFMRVLIGLSHEGYFAGDITDPDRFAEVRSRLKQEAEAMLGDTVADVLIIDYARQAR